MVLFLICSVNEKRTLRRAPGKTKLLKVKPLSGHKLSERPAANHRAIPTDFLGKHRLVDMN